MIKWVLDDMEANPDKYNVTYVTEYTNAAFLIDPEFLTAAENDGKFSGFQMKEDLPGIGQFGSYDKATWKWQTDAAGNKPRVGLLLADREPLAQWAEHAHGITGPERPQPSSGRSDNPVDHVDQDALGCTLHAGDAERPSQQGRAQKVRPPLLCRVGPLSGFVMNRRGLAIGADMDKLARRRPR